MSTQSEAQHYRALAQLLHNAGLEFMHLANDLDGQNVGLTADSLPPAPPAPGAPSFPAPSAPPAAPAAPGASDVPAAAGTRKRRTKAEIAADDAAKAEGFADAADKLAKTGAGQSSPGQAPAPAGLSPAPVAPGTPQVPAMQSVPGNLPPPPPAVSAPPAPPAPTAHDNLQAALMGFGNAVESVWPGQGHGNGYMGIIVSKMGVPNVEAVPAESVKPWTDWIIDVTNKFRADPAQLQTLVA